MVTVSLTVIFAFARIATGDMRWAPLAAGALTAFLVLLGGSLAPFGGDMDIEFINRIGQIAAAAAYVLVACKRLEFRPVRAGGSGTVEQ